MEEIDIDDMKHETDAAWLFVIAGKEVWLPKSQCDYNDIDGYVMVPQWLAEKKGLV